MVSVRNLGVLVGCLIVAACRPDLTETVSIVGAPRMLAVRSDPPEAAPKAMLAYTALYADGSGAITSAPIDWAFCEARKPLKELGPVNPSCLARSADVLIELGVGPEVPAVMPDIACRQFGPDAPEPVPGQPASRPADPDTTGGYYQPLRLLVSTDGSDVYTIAETRVSCGVAGAPPDLSTAFQQRYHLNANPAVESLGIVNGTVVTPLAVDDGSGKTNPVATGQRLSTRVTWRACPDPDVCGDGVCGPDETAATCAGDCMAAQGCSGAERYVNMDLGSRSLVVEREGMRVSWFATGGAFDLDHTGRDATDPASTSDNAWTAPRQGGQVHLWVVLRDDRGGVGWMAYVLDVR
jgi:hypothetical protein